jgi:two-component system OmpR family sensor kinase
MTRRLMSTARTVRAAAARATATWTRTPLWLRLIAGLLTLVAAALAITGTVGGSLLRGYLVGRVDGQLVQATQSLLAHGRLDLPAESAQQLPSAYFVELVGPRGAVLDRLRAPLRAADSSPDLPVLDETGAQARADTPFTVAATGGQGHWRVLVHPLARRPGTTLVVATSLDDVSSTVGQLVRIDLIVGAAVLAALGLAGYGVVRAALRPLRAVEDTAAAIAAGDLSRRVPDRDPRTEVGRLSGALNTMLGQVETAFRDREAAAGSAVASEERMRRFVADASHELRTPLTSIRGFAELYRQGAVTDPAEVAGLLRRIEDEAARMGLLVEDLLLLARLDEERPLDRAPVDLAELAAEVVDDARLLDADRAVTLDVAAGPVVVGGDPARLRQVLANLVGNAVTHTPAGTPVAVRVSMDGENAQVDVTDEGPGLSGEQAARLFERFYRAEPSRSRRRGGAGLGLAIVAALVRAHGGSVDVDTAPGRGTTFRVRLPLAGRAPRLAAAAQARDGKASDPDRRDDAPAAAANR